MRVEISAARLPILDPTELIASTIALLSKSCLEVFPIEEGQPGQWLSGLIIGEQNRCEVGPAGHDEELEAGRFDTGISWLGK